MGAHENTVQALRQFAKRTPYRDTPFEASTGKLNSDGTLIANAATGLDTGYVWVRKEGDRSETRALNTLVRTDITNIPVLVAEDNVTGELTVVRIRDADAITRFGEWSTSLHSQTAGDAFRTTIAGRNLKPGRVHVWISGTLKVNAEAFWYNDTTTARVLWEPSNANTLNLSSNVPAAVGGVNQHRWVVIALNPNATTPSLVAFNGTAQSITQQPLLVTQIENISVTAGYTRLAAVHLITGDSDESDLDDSDWEDLRPWIVDANYAAITGAVITGATITTSTINSTPIGAVTPSTGVFSTLLVTPSSSGGLTFGDGSGDTIFVINGSAANTKGIMLQSAAANRWLLRAQTAETGVSDVGSDLAFIRFLDNGTQETASFTQSRATGATLLTTNDSVNSGVTNTLSVRHNTSGTPANGLGAGLLFTGETSTTANTSHARIYTETIDITHASRKFKVTYSVFDTAERVAMILEASGSAAKIGFLGAAAALRQGSTTDLKDMLVTFGLITDSGATPVDLDGGKATVGRLGLNSVAGSTTAGDVWNDSTQKAQQVYMNGIEQTVSTNLLTGTASATVANTATETSIIGTGVGDKSLPANFWIAGKTVRLHLSGTFSDILTPTLRLRLKLGSTTIVDGTALALPLLAGTQEWRCECRLTCRTTGGSGTINGTIWFEYNSAAAVGSIDGFNIAPATTTFDTTASGALDLTIEWGTASASNTITATFGSVEVLN